MLQDTPNVVMPEAPLNDGFIYEFLSKINLELTLAVREWTRKETDVIKKQVEKEVVNKKAANPSIEDVKKELLDRKERQ